MSTGVGNGNGNGTLTPPASSPETILAAAHLRKKIINTMTSGILIFILGFALWNIDNFFCDHLNEFRSFTRTRGVLIELMGLMTHGHGWWHIMTGYGAFLINTSGICEWGSEIGTETDADIASLFEEMAKLF
jgi:hypothetical protein